MVAIWGWHVKYALEAIFSTQTVDANLFKCRWWVMRSMLNWNICLPKWCPYCTSHALTTDIGFFCQSCSLRRFVIFGDYLPLYPDITSRTYSSGQIGKKQRRQKGPGPVEVKSFKASHWLFHWETCSDLSGQKLRGWKVIEHALLILRWLLSWCNLVSVLNMDSF